MHNPQTTVSSLDFLLRPVFPSLLPEPTDLCASLRNFDVTFSHHQVLFLTKHDILHIDHEWQHSSLDEQNVNTVKCTLYHLTIYTKYLTHDIESIQKKALKITLPGTSYTDALDLTGLQRLSVRRDEITQKLFNEISSNENHKLHDLIPPRTDTPINVNLRTLVFYI